MGLYLIFTSFNLFTHRCLETWQVDSVEPIKNIANSLEFVSAFYVIPRPGYKHNNIKGWAEPLVANLCFVSTNFSYFGQRRRF